MELHQIRYFVTLAKCMNFTRAAEQCNVSQPALTKAIQKLEYELGGALVFRERHLSQLTDLGKLMLPTLERTLLAVEEARTNAEKFKRKKVATLRVALTPMISASILAKPIAALMTQLPGLQVDLVDAESSNVFEGLLSGDVSAALGSSYIGPTPERIERFNLFRERVFVACAEGNRMAEESTVSLKDLRSAKWLEAIDCEIFRAFREHLCEGQVAQPGHRAQGLQHLQHLVSANLGVMLTPEHAPALPDAVVRPIADFDFKHTVELFVVGGRQYSPALDAFIKICRRFDWQTLLTKAQARIAPKIGPFTAMPRRQRDPEVVRITA
jgi:LysR family hydrogen peroxide-inducible transcriptional activator